jgi:O-antigen/teichoic acid export membrane protein
MPKGDNYALGKWVVIIVGSGKLMDMIFGPSSEIIVLSKYYKFNIVLILMLTVLVIASNSFLIPRYGIEGAAWGAAFALVTFNFVKYIFIYTKFKIQPFDAATVKVLIIALVTLAANTIPFGIESVILEMLIKSALTAMLFSSLILVTNVSPEANELFKKGFRLIKSFVS